MFNCFLPIFTFFTFFALFTWKCQVHLLYLFRPILPAPARKSFSAPAHTAPRHTPRKLPPGACSTLVRTLVHPYARPGGNSGEGMGNGVCGLCGYAVCPGVQARTLLYPPPRLTLHMSLHTAPHHTPYSHLTTTPTSQLTTPLTPTAKGPALGPTANGPCNRPNCHRQLPTNGEGQVWRCGSVGVGVWVRGVGRLVHPQCARSGAGAGRVSGRVSSLWVGPQGVVLMMWCILEVPVWWSFCTVGARCV